MMPAFTGENRDAESGRGFLSAVSAKISHTTTILEMKPLTIKESSE